MSNASSASHGVAFTEIPGEAFVSRSRNQGEQTRENSYLSNTGVFITYCSFSLFRVLESSTKFIPHLTPQPTIRRRFI